MVKTLLTIVFFVLSLIGASSLEAAATPKKQLSWSELSSDQQQILSPLSNGWNEMDANRKNKWLGIAKRYPTMRPTEQENVKKRMQNWASLTPVQRQAARDRFRKLEKLPPEKKQVLSEEWEEYQRLPETEREKLRATTKSRKTATHPVQDPAKSVPPAVTPTAPK